MLCRTWWDSRWWRWMFQHAALTLIPPSVEHGGVWRLIPALKKCKCLFISVYKWAIFPCVDVWLVCLCRCVGVCTCLCIRGVTIHVFVSYIWRHGSVHGVTWRIHCRNLNKTGVRIKKCNAELMLDTQVIQGQLNCSPDWCLGSRAPPSGQCYIFFHRYNFFLRRLWFFHFHINRK